MLVPNDVLCDEFLQRDGNLHHGHLCEGLDMTHYYRTGLALTAAALIAGLCLNEIAFAQQATGSGGSGGSAGSCQVTSGPNKGKKGTYTDGGSWCEGTWGGTECVNSSGSSNGKCKAAKIATDDGVVGVVLDGNAGAVIFSRSANEVAAPSQDPLGRASPIVQCTSRAPDGQCSEATCERERDSESPTGVEIQSCAEFIVKCIGRGHTSTGGRNSATCARAAR